MQTLKTEIESSQQFQSNHQFQRRGIGTRLPPILNMHFLVLFIMAMLTASVAGECRRRNHLEILGDMNVLRIEDYHLAIDSNQKTFVTAGSVSMTMEYFNQKGAAALRNNATELYEYFDLFGANTNDYVTFVDSINDGREYATISFVLAYDFKACVKVWDAFYINLNSIRGVDVDDAGNFVVAGYNGQNEEWIMRHKHDGSIPDVWRFTGEQVVEGGIAFGFRAEWIDTYSPTQFKSFRHQPLGSPASPLDNAKQLRLDQGAYVDGGGKIFLAATKKNLQVIALRDGDDMVYQLFTETWIFRSVVASASRSNALVQRVDHNDKLEESEFRIALCNYFLPEAYFPFDGMELYSVGFYPTNAHRFQIFSNKEYFRYCLAVRQEEDLNVSSYLTYVPELKKHILGRLDVSSKTYTERSAIYEWDGYNDLFDGYAADAYAKIDENAIYLHAKVSGLSDQGRLYRLGILEQFFDGIEPVLPDSVLDAVRQSTGHTQEQYEQLEGFDADWVRMGLSMIIESYQGIERTTDFFEDYTDTNELSLFECPNPPYCHSSIRDTIIFCGESDETRAEEQAEKCNEVSVLFNLIEPLETPVMSITDVYMTPIANFISPNNWAKYYFECGRSLIRRETYSECQYEQAFVKYEKFLRDDLKERGPTACEQDTIFEPYRDLYSPPIEEIIDQLREEGLEVETIDWNQQRRADCYPIQTLYGFANIPQDESIRDPSGDPLSMLIVDEEQKSAKWRESLTDAMRGGFARLIYSEMDHDGFQATLISTVFQVVDVPYSLVVQRCGESISIDLIAEWPPSGTEPEVSIECVAATCPLFIEFDSEKGVMRIDGAQTSSESSAGTYMYRVWTSSITKEPLTLQELDSLRQEKGIDSANDLSDEDRFTLRRTEKLQSIVIRLFFPTAEIEDFLEDLPFYKASISGTSQAQSFAIDHSSLTKEDIVNVFSTQYSPEQMQVIGGWDNLKLETAIQEAWERKEDKTDYTQYSPVPEMDQNGLISINFVPSIKLPSYLKTDARRELQQQDAESGARLIDFLNNEYGQLYEYEAFACEDGSGQECAQDAVDQINLGECAPDDEECLALYCSLGDVACIQSKEQSQFEDYLDQLVDQEQGNEDEENVRVACQYPELESYNQEEDSCNLVEIYLGSFEDMVKVKYLPTSTEPQRRSLRILKEQPLRFEIVQANDNAIKIKLHFDRPADVSRDDQIEIQLDFNFLTQGRDYTNDALESFSSSFSYTVQAVEQYVVVDNSVDFKQYEKTQTEVTSALMLSTLIRVFTKGSLAQLWGTINGIQMGVYLSMTNVPIPMNASVFNNFMAGIATFDIPDVDMESVFEPFTTVLNCPEEDGISMGVEEEEINDQTVIGGVEWKDLKLNYFQSPNFNRKQLFDSLSSTEQQTLIRLAEAQEEQGWTNMLQNPDSFALPFVTALDSVSFSSSYLSRNLGTAFIWILGMTTCLVLILLLSLCSRVHFIHKLQDKLKKELLWNSILRTIMQTSLEFGFCCYFTLKYALYDGSPGAIINFAYAYVFTVLLLGFPIICLRIYTVKFELFKSIMYEDLHSDRDHQPTLKRDSQIDTKVVDWDTKLDQLVGDFYESDDLDSIVSQLKRAEIRGRAAHISTEEGLTTREIRFIKLLDELNYINTCEIVRTNEKFSAKLMMNGRFKQHYDVDMTREKRKQEFLAVYGDPISGLDLKKKIALLYPTYFTVVRIVFVLVTLGLWHRPNLQLMIRLIATLTSFCILVEVNPFQSKLSNFLELMNEVTLIFIIDCLFTFTSVMNIGNVNDVDMFGHQYNTGNMGSAANLESARSIAGWCYILPFASNIATHLIFLLIAYLNTMKLTCRKKYAILRRNKKREEAFNEAVELDDDVNKISKRSLFAGLCLRTFCNKRALRQDYKLGLVQKEREEAFQKHENSELQQIILMATQNGCEPLVADRQPDSSKDSHDDSCWGSEQSQERAFIRKKSDNLNGQRVDIPMPNRPRTYLKYASEEQQLEDFINPVQIFAGVKLVSQGMNAEPEDDSNDSEEAFAALNPAPNRSFFHRDPKLEKAKQVSKTYDQPKHSFIDEQTFKNEPKRQLDQSFDIEGENTTCRLKLL